MPKVSQPKNRFRCLPDAVHLLWGYLWNQLLQGVALWYSKTSGKMLLLVGGPGPPLWKIWKSVGMISNPIYGKIKKVKNGNQTTNQTVRIHQNQKKNANTIYQQAASRTELHDNKNQAVPTFCECVVSVSIILCSRTSSLSCLLLPASSGILWHIVLGCQNLGQNVSQMQVWACHTSWLVQQHIKGHPPELTPYHSLPASGSSSSCSAAGAHGTGRLPLGSHSW